MSDEVNENVDNNEPVANNDDVTAKLESLQKEREALLAKNQELLDEAKRAKEKARSEAQAAADKERERALKNGDYEQLLNSSEQARNEMAEKLAALQNQVSSEKTSNTSMKIAAELADGANAELLAEFIKPRIKYTDDGIKVLDQNGNLTVSSLDDLRNEFANSERYKALVRGNQSTGGGAAGDGGGASKAKIIPRAQFDKMAPNQQMAFIKDGGTLTD